jgi:hypothetical protein
MSCRDLENALATLTKLWNSTFFETSSAVEICRDLDPHFEISQDLEEKKRNLWRSGDLEDSLGILRDLDEFQPPSR